MSFTSEDLIKTGKYFKVASGYVPNQFTIRIIKEGVYDQEAGKAGNPLYLLNLEPWVIEEMTLPQIRFNTGNDIYMDPDTLIKPDYVLSVETMGKLELTIREKSDLAIHRSLIRCQKEFYNEFYEGAGSLGENYSIEVRMKSQRFDGNSSNGDNIFGDNVLVFGRAILREISNPTHAYGEKGFLKYNVTFDVNCMAETYQLNPKKKMKSLFSVEQNKKIASNVGRMVQVNKKLENQYPDKLEPLQIVTGARAEQALRAQQKYDDNTARNNSSLNPLDVMLEPIAAQTDRTDTYNMTKQQTDRLFNNISNATTPGPITTDNGTVLKAGEFFNIP
jgi:hypothetical protein